MLPKYRHRILLGAGRRAKHTIYAIQPYDARTANADLPRIDKSKSLAYVHCDSSLVGNRRLDTVLAYGVINGIAQASWDVDAMRPDHPDVGAFVTFTTPDHEAVVDDRLKVHGLDGLRVADASIFPTMPSGNTNAPSIMVGEKCADLL